MMKCIDLKATFGRTLRITFDEAYSQKHRRRENLDPWMMQIPCVRGIILPHGGSRLAVEIDGRPITARKLVDSGVCELHRDGDHEKTFTFDVRDFAAVAAIVHPRRRRQVSQEQREAARQRMLILNARMPSPVKPQEVEIASDGAGRLSGRVTNPGQRDRNAACGDGILCAGASMVEGLPTSTDRHSTPLLFAPFGPSRTAPHRLGGMSSVPSGSPPNSSSSGSFISESTTSSQN